MDSDCMGNCPGCDCSHVVKKVTEENPPVKETLVQIHAPDIKEGFFHCGIF